MAKAKIINISGPMDVKHVGGVNLITITGKSKPAGLPVRPNFLAGPMGAPMRSNTLPSSMQRPGLPSNNSGPIMRTESLRQFTEARRRIENDQYQTGSDSTTGSVPAPPIVPLQSSMSIRRKKIGQERMPSEPVSVVTSSDSEPEAAPAPPSVPLQTSLSIRRKNIVHERIPSDPVSVITSTDSESEAAPAPPAISLQPTMSFRRKGMGHQRNPSAPVAIFVAPEPELEAVPDPFSKDLLKAKSRNPLARFAFNTQQESTFPAAATQAPMRWPTRPKRADSGTAIDIDNVPAQERPVPFKEIQAVQSFEDRMAMYKKSRDYWATANHGLSEWTQRLTGARLVAAQV